MLSNLAQEIGSPCHRRNLSQMAFQNRAVDSSLTQILSRFCELHTVVSTVVCVSGEHTCINREVFLSLE